MLITVNLNIEGFGTNNFRMAWDNDMTFSGIILHLQKCAMVQKYHHSEALKTYFCMMKPKFLLLSEKGTGLGRIIAIKIVFEALHSSMH